MNLLKLFRQPVVKPMAEPVTDLPSYQGYVDAVTERHVAGWVRDLADEAGKVSVEVGLDTTGEVLLRGQAAAYLPGLRAIGVGDGEHGFSFRLPRRLTQQERDSMVIRPLPDGAPLTRSDYLATQYNPIQHIVMDLVDNCNLRCPFCVYDYTGTHTTHTMTEATFDAVVRFAPYVTEGNFWFSCLHEPTLHPRLMEFMDKVPSAYRSKVFYTTNLAKRMPPAYFEALADSGMHHINISIESMEPAIYEKMRKGARFRIFKENWDHLVNALGHGSAPPKLRYISLAYKSTFRQLPALIDHLLQERRGAIVEVRHTYDEPHIPRAFRQAEYLGREDWLWLRDQLAHYTAEEVMLVLPPGLENPAFDNEVAAWSEHVASMYELSGPAPPAIHAVAPEPFDGPLPKGFHSQQYGLRVFWDGRLEVKAIWGEPDVPAPPELRLRTTNVRDIDDVDAFLNSLPY
jgi:organic radical activating enzyme